MGTIRLIAMDTSDTTFESVVALFCESFFHHHYSTRDFEVAKANILKHTKHKGFKGIVALNAEGEVIGFAYGYPSQQGQFYRQQLERVLTKEKRIEWMSDAFEFVSLAVRADYRRQGVATLLHQELLDGLPNKKVMLTAGESNIPAKHFYEKMGWTVIEESVVIIPGIEQQTIMGLVMENRLNKARPVLLSQPVS